MSTVRLSPESARVLRRHADTFGPSVPSSALSRAMAELDRALARLDLRKPSPKKKEARKAVRALKQDKRAIKNAETAAIRDEVLERDDHRCVVCGRTERASGQPLQMDHFWPKGRTPQSVETCWTLCSYDHDGKTRNRPSPTWWLEAFALHARRNGYSRQSVRAENRIAALALIEQAGEASRG